MNNALLYYCFSICFRIVCIYPSSAAEEVRKTHTRILYPWFALIVFLHPNVQSQCIDSQQPNLLFTNSQRQPIKLAKQTLFHSFYCIWLHIDSPFNIFYLDSFLAFCLDHFFSWLVLCSVFRFGPSEQTCSILQDHKKIGAIRFCFCTIGLCYAKGQSLCFQLYKTDHVQLGAFFIFCSYDAHLSVFSLFFHSFFTLSCPPLSLSPPLRYCFSHSVHFIILSQQKSVTFSVRQFLLSYGFVAE